jgi:hypothetical protein
LIISHDKRKDKIKLYLISSTLNKSIFSTLLYEFGEVENAKMFWDILEMKYSGKSVSKVYGEDVESHCG